MMNGRGSRKSHSRSLQGPSPAGAHELAGLCTYHGDREALERALAWFEKAQPHDAWQTELLEALQQTHLSRQARALAWSRLTDDPAVGAEMARVLAEAMTSADRARAKELLADLPSQKGTRDLRDALVGMVDGPTESPATRPGD